MHVEDIMERNIEAIEARTSAEDAWTHMRSRRLRSLLVTDGAQILGCVTRACVRGSGARHRRDKVVADFLPQGRVTAAPDCGLRQAAIMLEGRADGCVPVLANGHLAGVITLSGLLRRLAALGRPARRGPRRATATESRWAPATNPTVRTAATVARNGRTVAGQHGPT